MRGDMRKAAPAAKKTGQTTLTKAEASAKKGGKASSKNIKVM